jgi:hypothetical protein
LPVGTPRGEPTPGRAQDPPRSECCWPQGDGQPGRQGNTRPQRVLTWGRLPRGTVSNLVNKVLNRRGQFVARERRSFGAGKVIVPNDLRRRRTLSAEAPNCPRRQPPREIVPSRGRKEVKVVKPPAQVGCGLRASKRSRRGAIQTAGGPEYVLRGWEPGAWKLARPDLRRGKRGDPSTYSTTPADRRGFWYAQVGPDRRDVSATSKV